MTKILTPSSNKTSTLVEEDFQSTYIHAATSDNTRAAYQSDIAHFLKAGGPLPTTPQVIETYLRN